MLKKITLSLGLVIIVPSLFAAQCPPASVFSHVKGQKWQISTAAALQGWIVLGSEYDEDNSDLTHLKPGAPLEVNLNAYFIFQRVASCLYSLDTQSSSYIGISNRFHKVDMDNIPQPPFEQRMPYYYTCHTTSLTPEACSWKWG